MLTTCISMIEKTTGYLKLSIMLNYHVVTTTLIKIYKENFFSEANEIKYE